MILAEIVAISFGLFVAILYVLSFQIRSYRRKSQKLARLRMFSTKSQSTFQQKQDAATLRTFISKTNLWLSKASLTKEYLARSDNAGIKIAPLTWIFYVLTAGLVSSLLLASVTPIWPLAFVVGFGLTLAGSRSFVISRERHRRKLFEQELPEFLTLIASSLRAGLPLTRAMESVASQGNGEVERQMRRAASEIGMGTSPTEALGQIAMRMQSADMTWVNVALAIQRETGGNLSVILDSVAETVRERASIQREVSTLSAESRLSAWILVALPIGVFTAFYFFRRDYVSIFWTTTTGALMFAVFVSLIVAGTVWMRKIIRITV